MLQSTHWVQPGSGYKTVTARCTYSFLQYFPSSLAHTWLFRSHNRQLYHQLLGSMHTICTPTHVVWQTLKVLLIPMASWFCTQELPQCISLHQTARRTVYFSYFKIWCWSLPMKVIGKATEKFLIITPRSMQTKQWNCCLLKTVLRILFKVARQKKCRSKNCIRIDITTEPTLHSDPR